MVLHNPNNWHWVNKDASAWAKEYFDENLIGICAHDESGVSVSIDKVLSVDGDVDVSQRKGKVITLFDVKLQLEYSGKLATGAEVSGTITIPEVAHDTEIEDYVFEITNYSDTSDKQPVRDLIRNQLTPDIRTKLALFGATLIEQHGKDIQHTKETDPKYRSSPGSANATSSSQTKPIESTSVSSTIMAEGSERTSVVNTTQIKENFEFQTSAEELYITFTDVSRVAAFTRSSPNPFDVSEGGKFKLFGGNVEGEFVTLGRHAKIVQKWRLSSWPSGTFP
ncbi:hypothetical protein TWF694_008657 [Orbilia ellipsospora]|uniref:Activator of Hsp90 ATPase AHSA1-like N-terminal domain-containing protein n=1 Tax=Orbilia ellipsospora TaxID=2528407 RepID=A0AAV9XHQ8_9PEZI